MHMSSHRQTSVWTIYGQLLLVAIIWGGTWIAAKLAVVELSPLTVAVWRYLIASLCLAGMLLGSGEAWPVPKGRQWGLLLLAALSGIFIYNLLFLYGLQRVGAGRGALVVALNPALVALVAWLLGGERMTPLKGAGIVTALFGSLLVVGKGDPLAMLRGEVGIGEWLVVGCVLCWTIYTFVGRRATLGMSPLALTFYASAGGGLLLLATGLGLGELHQSPLDFSWQAGGAIVFLGVLGTALAFTWYADGVRQLGAARAATFINLVPVAAVLQAAWLLGERLEPAELLGGVLVLVGVAMTNLANSRYPWVKNQGDAQ